MTADVPAPGRRRNRPDASLRRRSLELDVDGENDASAGSSTGPGTSTFQAALAATPDLRRGPSSGDRTVAGRAGAGPLDDDLFVARPEAGDVAAGRRPGTDADHGREDERRDAPLDGADEGDDLFSTDDDGAPEPVPAPVARDRSTRPRPAAAPRSPVPWWRRAGFAAAVVILVGAIPWLGREGYRTVVHSTDGKEADRGAGKDDPNYERPVESTPTMIFVQSGADGFLRSLTFVSLNSEKGGTMIFVPLATPVAKPAFGVGLIEMAYNLTLPKIDTSQRAAAGEVANLLNVGIDDIVGVDDRSIQQLVSPVGPLSIENPAPMTLADGTELPAGPVTLQPSQVGPYLGYVADGEDQLSQFVRQELVWRAWLNAIAASRDPGIVTGGTANGVGKFLATLASGSVHYAVLPGAYDDEGIFLPDAKAMDDLVLEAVPVPDAAYPGSRTVVRLMNGVEPGPPPTAVIRRVVGATATVSVLGNGPSFDNDRTVILYRDASKAAAARQMLHHLGSTRGSVRLDEAQPDNIDLTIILGRDAVDAASSGGGT